MNKLLDLLARRPRHASAEDLSARLDGRLAQPAATRLDAHLAACPQCRQRSDGLAAARAALRSLPRVSPARSFRLREADVAAARSPSRPWYAPPVVRAAGALAVVLAASAAFFVVASVRSNGGDQIRGLSMSSGQPAAQKALSSPAFGDAAAGAAESGVTGTPARPPVAAPRAAAPNDATTAALGANPETSPSSGTAAAADGAALAPATGAASDGEQSSPAAGAEPQATAAADASAGTPAARDSGGHDGARRTAIAFIAVAAAAATIAFVVWSIKLRRKPS